MLYRDTLAASAVAFAVCFFLPSVSFAEAVSSDSSDTTEASSEESETTEVQSLVVTANRFPTDPEKVGSSVSIVRSEEIELRRQPTVLEVLRTVPGLEVVQAGGGGRATSVFIRAGESDHTLVLIDGVRVNENTTGQFDFSDLRAENIEKIEVLRGAQSVLYGSEAIGGVINIITKRAEEGISASGFAEGGSFGTQQYKASASWGSENFSSSNTISYFWTDGISVADKSNGNSERDSHDNLSVSSRTIYEFSDDGEMNFTARYSRADAELDGFSDAPVDDLNFEQSTENFVGSIEISKSLRDWFTPTVEIGFYDKQSEGTDADSEFNRYEIVNRSFSVDTQLDFFPCEFSTISFGHTYEKREGKNEGNFDEQRDLNSIYLQNQLSFSEALFLTGGVRHDFDSKFGEQTTYRATLAYLLDDTGTRLHASYGSGFKAPSFNELFFPNFGNPDLDPETSWGYDVGIEQSFIEDAVSLDITFFQNQIDELITFDSSTFLAENIQEAEVLGIEAQLLTKLVEGFDASVSYTWTDSENKTTGNLLPRRPKHRGVISLLLTPTDKLNAAVTFIMVNDRQENDGSRMDNYERVDLATSYAVTENIMPFVRIENLFDEDYQEVTGFGTPGFAAYGGLEFSL